MDDVVRLARIFQPVLVTWIIISAILVQSGKVDYTTLLASLLLGIVFSPYVLEAAHLIFSRGIYQFNVSINDPWSLRKAVGSFSHYEHGANLEVFRMRTAYARVGFSRKRIGREVGYASKLDRLQQTNAVNSKVTGAIAQLAIAERGPDARPSLHSRFTDLNKVRESVKHFVRDWSVAGRVERDSAFTPILDALRMVPQHSREEVSVLVPGCGLGRLAWEISQLGFDTTANEISPYMFLAFRFLLSPLSTTKTEQHVIHPDAYWFSHRKSTESLMRAINFPDALPRLSENFHLLEGDFMDLMPDNDVNLKSILPPMGTKKHPESYEASGRRSYDYIITLFFIDTSPNILNTMQQIYALLKPGGVWINLGPLLWSVDAAMQLSLDEMLKAIELTGFILDVLDETQSLEISRKSKEVSCEYTVNQEAMMRWIYLARFWVARKP